MPSGLELFSSVLPHLTLLRCRKTVSSFSLATKRVVCHKNGAWSAMARTYCQFNWLNKLCAVPHQRESILQHRPEDNKGTQTTGINGKTRSTVVVCWDSHSLDWQLERNDCSLQLCRDCRTEYLYVYADKYALKRFAIGQSVRLVDKVASAGMTMKEFIGHFYNTNRPKPPSSTSPQLILLPARNHFNNLKFVVIFWLFSW